MGRELQERTIDDRVYSFEQFSASVALKTLTKLTRIFGEPLTVALSTFFKGGKVALSLDSQVDPDALSRAVRTLIERMDEDEVVALVKKLTAEQVLCDGKKIVSFDEHFCGELPHLFRVLWASLEVQYGNFIDVVTASIPGGGKATKSTSAAGIQPR